MPGTSSVTFNPKILRESARNLAKQQTSKIRDADLTLIKPRLHEAKKVLTDAYRILAKTAKSEKEISPSAEWLIDNFYIIQEQIVQVEYDFPVEYQKSTPSLVKGEHQGLPRVFELVLNLVTYTDNILDADILTRYVQSYQKEETLMLGEIWALPIMARFVLILQLADRAKRINSHKKMQLDIQQMLHGIHGKSHHEEPGYVTHKLSKWMRSNPDYENNLSLLTELHNQVQSANLLYDEQERWFRYRFNQLDFSFDEAVRLAAQIESRLQVGVQNAIISLRKISETDWSEMVEECSHVDQILQGDPAGIYGKMDLATRDSYRKTVERISRHSNHAETKIAEIAVTMCRETITGSDRLSDDYLHNPDTVKQHIGYYLKGDGYAELVQKTGYSIPLREKTERILGSHAGFYLGMISLHTVGLLGILWVITGATTDAVTILLLLLLALFPAMDLSVSAINRIFAMILSPRILPKMEFKNGIPEEFRTLVVVPALLSSRDDVRKQLENLEIRALANPAPSLQFALLSDFPDSPDQQVSNDKDILESVERIITRLNQKHRSTYGNKFYLLHRKRIWNATENCWMGWERKRGKLEELNRLLIDTNAKTTFSYISGDFISSIRIHPVRFVITLDADTKMPPDSALDLVQTASHPLNRAFHDTQKNRISKGYGIIQPRISIPPDSAGKTLFSRIFSGNVGLDPYSTAISDIYQDLMGEAVFTGKGIYDVQAFYTVMNKRLPENRILSHDLLESTYLRTGLATDIELFDDYPGTYVSFSKRNHRWTRGDWQIASWFFKKIPGNEGKVVNPINLLSKWKIFDNLRRSLTPFFLTLFFPISWFWLPGYAWVWTLAAFGILAFPIYVTLSTDIINRPARVKWKLYLGKVRSNMMINSIQAVSTLIILPHQAVVNLDAILRTFWRLTVSGRSLLEWTSASLTESSSLNSFRSYLLSMAGSVILGISIIVLTATIYPGILWLTLPFSILWIFAPVYVWKISQPLRQKRDSLTEDNRLRLRGYARRTWFYFERYLTEENSWLPPDNVQEDPPLPPTSRTSPTNIGLALVSIQSAYNMGFIPFCEFLERTERTLKSLVQLDRYRGHFYNWYDIKLGTVLNPVYISTVDSGNLAAGLIVIKEAVKQFSNSKQVNASIWKGLFDTINTVQDIFKSFQNSFPGYERDVFKRVCALTGRMVESIQSDCPDQFPAQLERLESLKEQALLLSEINLMHLRNELGDERLNNLLFWLESPLKQIDNFILETRILAESGFGTEGLETVRKLLKSTNEETKHGSVLTIWSRQISDIASICNRLTKEMDFSFLYHKKRGLFTIGYNVEKSAQDASTYDLLASEARIASYIAISKGDVPAEHWFRLSRRLTSLKKNEILLSWGGTIFEYLMPLLFMRSYPNTLLSHTYNSIIRWQQNYAHSRGFPWGASESAYYFLNLDMHYQYRAFGTPGLGMKRGLAEEYVIAPYASILSLMVDPNSAVENLKKLESEGGQGLCGFYDAIDYTRSRLKDKETHKVVKMYMAHHHGMSLAALDNVLNDWNIHHHFHSNPMIVGCELLLQERIPRGVPIKEPHPIDVELEPGEQQTVTSVVEHAGINNLDETPPRVHILSNGSYSTFTTQAGTGYSKYQDMALTSWGADPIQDSDGLFFYIRDLENGKFWSAGHQPVLRKPDRYDTWFYNGQIVTSRVDDWIETTTEICVSPDVPFEFRRLTLTNYADREKTLDLTSYAEVVLNKLEDHNAHPAFSKLFVQTEYLARHHALLVKRRPRSPKESTGWLVHTFAGLDPDSIAGDLQFETERSNFIGRGRTIANPVAMEPGSKLSGGLGNVSDPIISLRYKIHLKPGEKKQLTFGLGWAETKEIAIEMADDFDNPHATDRVFDLASVYSQIELSHMDITSKQAHYFQKLSSWIVYHDKRFRADEKILRQNRKTQQGLWAYGLSGDLPLVVFRIREPDQLKHVKRLIKAHSFWKQKGLSSDLLILNDHPPSYADELQEFIQREVESVAGVPRLNSFGGVYLYKSEKIPPADITLILSVAHVVFEHQLPDFGPSDSTAEINSWNEEDQPTLFNSQKNRNGRIDPLPEIRSSGLTFYNGFGGFSESGDEYRIMMNRDPASGLHTCPPTPWINVISNPDFGFIVSETGAGYTWSVNSRENKLTEWSNDPVTDAHSEAFYLRDEHDKFYWTPTPGPAPGNGPYTTAHGFGYTRFEHESEGIKQDLRQFVALEKPVKISLITVTNNDNKTRNLSLYSYQDWVMGVRRSLSCRFVIPTVSNSGNTIYATNHYNNEFAGRVAFTHLVNGGSTKQVNYFYTTDRESFIGRNRSLKAPLAVNNTESLDNRAAIGGAPCGAIQAQFKLEPNESAHFISLMGESKQRHEVDRLIRKFSTVEAVLEELNAVKRFWNKKLGRIRIQTPNKALNLMMNGWLMYQTISCRLWARTAYYQAGGAFGFRDQLQDVTAALYSNPQLTRDQLILHAAHQFKEGDVLHWWHPPTGRGIRSRISDDRLWLPYSTLFYLNSTGDTSILDENIQYVTSRPLEPGELEAYLIPDKSFDYETLYEHCCKAIDISLAFGSHGLPLIGAGDWNDGMNHVGKEGKGESVWLGFFLYPLLKKFASISKKRDDIKRSETYTKTAAELKKNLNSHGWDGEWYLRAFYDDGTPLGSSENEECRIDAISQAWSVIAGVADRKRQIKALASLEKYLVSEQDGMIRLLTPPFDKTEKDPGYIKGYIPGVRENGGQYTHAALWSIKAFAEAGFGDKAVRFLDMINPINHALSEEAVSIYKVEPYVVAADIYGEPPLTGQGGWTWYTGSAGWMYRIALESVLGITYHNGDLIIQPVITSQWKHYSVSIKTDDEGTVYNILVHNPDKIQHGALTGVVDEEPLSSPKKKIRIKLKSDGNTHNVELRLVHSDVLI